MLGHAGEGTFLTADEQAAVIRSFVKSADGQVPVIAGITMEGTKVAAEEAKRAVNAGARPVLSIPHTAGCGSAIRRVRRKTVIGRSIRRVVCR